MNPMEEIEIPWQTGPGGQMVGFPGRAGYIEAVHALYDGGFTMCSDLCGADYLTHPGRTLPAGVQPERFEVVVNLLDIAAPNRVRIRVQVPEDQPEVDSLFEIYPGVEAMEREAFDMFGIRFAGHPDLTRILMPEDWEGYPLRKDFDVGAVPVRFKEPGVAPKDLVHTGRDREDRLAAAAASASTKGQGSMDRLAARIPRRRKP